MIRLQQQEEDAQKERKKEIKKNRYKLINLIDFLMSQTCLDYIQISLLVYK